MKINKYNALQFWEECYGNKQYAEDFNTYDTDTVNAYEKMKLYLD